MESVFLSLMGCCQSTATEEEEQPLLQDNVSQIESMQRTIIQTTNDKLIDIQSHFIDQLSPDLLLQRQHQYTASIAKMEYKAPEWKGPGIAKGGISNQELEKLQGLEYQKHQCEPVNKVVF
jgi:hypothetical protein